MRIQDLPETVLFIYAPVLVLVLIAFLWARFSKVPRLAKVLVISAAFWLVILTLAFALGLATAMTCNGNFIRGYGDCTLVPQSWADASFTIGFLTYAAAAVYTAILFATGLVVEWVARNRR